jgi:hypothetical protein
VSVMLEHLVSWSISIDGFSLRILVLRILCSLGPLRHMMFQDIILIKNLVGWLGTSLS